MLYLDSSALLKRYVDEPDSDRFTALAESDVRWLTCRLTWVEVWRNLGRRLPTDAARSSKEAFKLDWGHLTIVEIDATLAETPDMWPTRPAFAASTRCTWPHSAA
jgi:predicted nucleic acid-binding protein